MHSYTYRDKLYTVLPCTPDDIPSHIEKVFVYWGEHEVELQRQRMLDAITKGCAYKLVCEGVAHTFAYYDQLDGPYVNGIALWWSSLRIFFMYGHWFRYHKGINITYIYPHKKDLVVFKPIIEDSNIEWYLRDTTRPLIIDLWSPKCERIKELMEKLGMKEI